MRESTQKLLIASSAFIKGFHPPDYLLDGVLQRRFIYALTGMTNSGKTAVLLLLAVMVALKYGELDGRELAGGRVLYLAGENTDDIRMRWIAMAHRMGFDINKIPVHFIDAMQRTTAQRFSLSRNMRRLHEEVDEIGGVILAMVDTSSAFFEGINEDDNVQAGDHARLLRQLTTLPGGPCVLVACHPTKYATEEGLMPRGGGAFLNEIDGNLTCVNEADQFIKMHWLKKWRGPEFLHPIYFNLIRGIEAPTLKTLKGKKLKTVMVEELTEDEYQKKATRGYNDQDRVLTALHQGTVSIANIARTCGWFVGDENEPHKSKVSRIIGQLEKNKFVRKYRGQWQLTQEGKSHVEKSVPKAGTAGA
jgi:hypothetical protein